MDSEKFSFEQFGMIAIALAEGWAIQKPMSEKGLRFFHSVICDWELADVEQALKTHARSEKGEWRPSPAHLIAHMPKANAEISAKEQALLAWGRVRAALASHTPYGAPYVCRLSDKIIKENMGGWGSLSRTPNGDHGGKDDLQWKAKQFLEFFEVGFRIEKVRENVRQLEAKNNPVLSLNDQLKMIEQNET